MLHNNPKEKLSEPPETLQLRLASLSPIPPQKSIFEEETEGRNHPPGGYVPQLAKKKLKVCT